MEKIKVEICLEPEMPDTIPAALQQRGDGEYRIFLKSDLNAEQKSAEIAHEMKHIFSGHFTHKDVDEIELSAHENDL